MQRNTLLIVMVAAGSAMCWWPSIIPPNLDSSGWKTPLILIALVTGLGTALSDEGSRWLMIASVLGGVAGVFCGFKLWPPTDGMDASLGIGLATFTSMPVSVIAVVAGVALRESKIAQKNRRLIWCAFLSSFAFAPTVVALTRLLLTRRR
jgi:predicted permease